MDNNIWMEILMWFLGILSTLITSVLVPFLASWLKSKTNNENLQYVITELSQTVATSVDYVNQTFVDQLKADGEFNKDNQEKALKLALNMCLNSLSDKAVKILGKEGIDLESIITKYIESAIANSKK